MPRAGEGMVTTLLGKAIRTEYDIWQSVNSEQSDR